MISSSNLSSGWLCDDIDRSYLLYLILDPYEIPHYYRMLLQKYSQNYLGKLISMILWLKYQVFSSPIQEFSAYLLILAVPFRLHFIWLKSHSFLWTLKFIFTFVLFFGYGVIRVFIFVCLQMLWFSSSIISLALQSASSSVEFTTNHTSFFISHGLAQIFSYHTNQLIISIFFYI